MPLAALEEFDTVAWIEQLSVADPLDPDGDGVSDGDEVAAGTDPLAAPPPIFPATGPIGVVALIGIVLALGTARLQRRDS